MFRSDSISIQTNLDKFNRNSENKVHEGKRNLNNWAKQLCCFQTKMYRVYRKMSFNGYFTLSLHIFILDKPFLESTFKPSYIRNHYENSPIQIYWKCYHQNNNNFQIKKSDIFHISAQNIVCGYSLDPPRRGGSNEYPQTMFLSRNKKNNVYPCEPQFYYIYWGLKGSIDYRRVSVMYLIMNHLI